MPLTNIKETTELTGEDSKRLSPAKYFIKERQEYSYILDDGADGLLINGNPCRPLIKDTNIYRISITHGLGLTCLQPTKSGKPYGEPTWVEVFSYKYETPEKHYRFFATIVEDLFKQAANLPFSFEAITQRGVTESPLPPTPLFTYYFLKQNLLAFKAAIETVLAEPHRLLCDFPDQVLLHEVNEVDGDVIISILQSPETWAEVQSIELAIANSLQMDGHRYAPTHVWQRMPEETFDTHENRFVLYFLRQILITSELLPKQSWWRLVENLAESKTILEITSLLRETIAHPMFQDVGDLHQIPFNSQVLMRRDGYRDLFILWQQFQSSAQPLFAKWKQAMDVRNMHHLYEIWVFFELINAIGGCKKITARPSDEFGLEYAYTQADFENKEILYYNKTFHPHYNKPFRSYSMVLRPDYVWVRPDKTKVILDAKFSMWVDENELVIGAEIEGEGDIIEAIREGHPIRRDLYKMHTYRDALVGTQAAVIIYPGSENVFMCANQRDRITNFTLHSVLNGVLEGIGAISCMPNESKFNHY